MRVTVGTIHGLLATGNSRERNLQAYPYLELEDIDAALAYAAWTLDKCVEADGSGLGKLPVYYGSTSWSDGPDVIDAYYEDS